MTKKGNTMGKLLTGLIGATAGIVGGYLIWGRGNSLGAVSKPGLHRARNGLFSADTPSIEDVNKLKQWATLMSNWASYLLQVHPPVTTQPWHACRVRLKSLLQFASKVETTIYTSANDIERDRDKLLLLLNNAKNAIGVSGPPLPMW